MGLHVLEESDGAGDLETLDGLGGFPGVLVGNTKVRTAGLCGLLRVEGGSGVSDLESRKFSISPNSPISRFPPKIVEISVWQHSGIAGCCSIFSIPTFRAQRSIRPYNTLQQNVPSLVVSRERNDGFTSRFVVVVVDYYQASISNHIHRSLERSVRLCKTTKSCAKP